MSKIPFCATLPITDANTNYNLYDLLRAVDPQIPRRCQMMQIQYHGDLSADILYIGNPDTLSATNRGAELSDTQAQTIQSVEANLILLDNIALRCTGAGHSISVILVTR